MYSLYRNANGHMLNYSLMILKGKRKTQATATKTDELDFMMHQKRIKRHIDRARGQPVRSTEHFQIIYLIRDKGSDIQDM